MDNISTLKNSADKVNKLYADLNYYDVYGGSVIIFIILMVILFLVYSYTSIMINVQPIKDNWVEERCNPKVIPFAGFINKPEGASTIQYTQDNFNFCMQNILTSITGYAVEPVTFLTSMLNNVYGEIASTLNAIRAMISNVRTYIENIAKEIFGRLLNIMTPIQTLLISFIDLAEKIKAIFAAGIYTSLGTYYTLKSFLGAILQLIVIILLIMAGLLVGLWILPFTWPMAITGTAVFLSVSIPLLIVMVFMNQVLHVDINSPIPSVPGPGHCFDKNTSLLMKDGTYKCISDVEVGEELFEDGIITAKLKLDAENIQMYYLENIIVSGSHKVKFQNKWIYVKDHPERKPVLSYSEPYIYCLNTCLKTIHIDAYEFSDWDEVFDEEKLELLSDLDLKSELTEHIHEYYDGGFYSDTKLKLKNGELREISNLEVGTILSDGAKITGIVEIWGENLGHSSESFCLYGVNVTPVHFNIKIDLEKQFGEKKYLLNNGRKIYHLLTDKENFYVGNRKYYHYNSCIELFLEKYRGKLLSMKYV
jgi:hypothetical protein